MEDKKFDENIKNRVKKEIEIPNDLNNVVVETISKLEDKKCSKNSKLKLVCIRMAQTLVGLTGALVVGGTAYAAITGNSIINLFGFGKASVSFEENAIELNKVFTSENGTVEVKKVLFDDKLLMTEYEIVLSDEALEKINEYIDDDSEVVFPIIINGIDTSELVLNNYYNRTAENTITGYEIIDLAEIDELNSLEEMKVVFGVESYIKLNENEKIYFTTEEALSANIKVNKDEDQTHDFEFDTEKISVSDMKNTELGSYATVELKDSNCTDIAEGRLTFELLDKDENELNYKAFVVRSNFVTVDDKLFQVAFYEDIDNYIDLNETYRVDGNLNDNYKEGTLDEKIVLMVTDDIVDIDKIKLNVYQAGELIIEDEELNVDDKVDNEYEFSIIDLTDTEKLENEYKEIDTIKENQNKYYSEGKEKLDIKELTVAGVKIDMEKEEAKEALKEYYLNKGVEITFEDVPSGEIMTDDIDLVFYKRDGKEYVQNIQVINNELLETKSLQEFISKYSTNKEITEIKRVNGNVYKVLYGTKEDAEKIIERKSDDLSEDVCFTVGNSNGVDLGLTCINDEGQISATLDESTKEFTSFTIISAEQ